MMHNAMSNRHQLLRRRKMRGAEDSWQQSNKWDGDSQDIVVAYYLFGVACLPDFVPPHGRFTGQPRGRSQPGHGRFVSQDFNS